MENVSPAVELFKAKAAPVSTKVIEVKGLDEALDYALAVCEQKDFCEMLLSGCGEDLSPAGEGLCRLAEKKTFAAPDLSDEAFAALKARGEAKGFTIIRDGLRKHMAGIDIGFSVAERAIAETATCVIPCQREDSRLAGMISEVHVVALPKSKIVESSYEIEDYLNKLMSEVMYTAFISGCSRTSDIERVLTLGVHGPLEMHVALMEEE